MAEKLSVTIALEGGAEIERQLADIGAAGKKAFADITKSAEQVGGFKNLKPEEVTAKLKEMGVTGADSINKIQGAVKSAGRLETVSAAVQGLENRFASLRATVPALGAALGNLFSSANKAADGVKGLGVRASEARAGVAALAQGLNAMGAGPVGRAATAIANIGTRFGALATAAAAVGGVSAAMIKFAAAAVESEKALTQLQAVSNQSFASLSALSNVFAQGGTKLNQFATEFGSLSEKIASVGEQAAKQEGLRQQAEEAAKGLKVTELGAITLEERVKSLLETLSRVSPDQQWLRLADIFKNMGNDIERARIGKALVLSPESIATLTLGADKLREMTQKAQQLGVALDAVDQKTLQRLIQSQNQASSLFDAIKVKMGALVAPAVASFWEGFTARLQQLIPVFTQIASSIGQMDFSRVGAAAADFLAIIARISAGWAAMITGQVSLRDVLGRLLQEAGTLAVEIGVAIGTGIVQGIISAIQSKVGQIWAAIKQGLGGPAPSGTPAPAAAGGGQFAGGGLLGGRGTGTSDSNLAWVSRGEYITPARAVRQPGVLAFLEALRRSGGNLSRVLDGMGRFALGGMVPRSMAIPAFAAGGLAGGSNVTIQFPGLPAISGLRASADVVDQLHRAAALAQVRSGGRKPSRYS